MFYDDSILDLIREAIMITLKIAGPILVAGMIIGFVISILQSVTSIQDQSLSLVPKIVAMLLVTILLLPWVVHRLLEFSSEMFHLV